MTTQKIDEKVDRVVEAAKKVGKSTEEYRWQVWRQKLLDAWANNCRALMTALLEDGPDEQT